MVNKCLILPLVQSSRYIAKVLNTRDLNKNVGSRSNKNNRGRARFVRSISRENFIRCNWNGAEISPANRDSTINKSWEDGKEYSI